MTCISIPRIGFISEDTSAAGNQVGGDPPGRFVTWPANKPYCQTRISGTICRRASELPSPREFCGCSLRALSMSSTLRISWLSPGRYRHCVMFSGTSLPAWPSACACWGGQPPGPSIVNLRRGSGIRANTGATARSRQQPTSIESFRFRSLGPLGCSLTIGPGTITYRSCLFW